MRMERECGREELLETLTVIILDIAAAFNVKNNITTTQAAFIARTILSEHKTLKYAEMYVFANNCKMGKYGKSYDRIDMPVILEWLEKYYEEQSYAIEEINSNKKTTDLDTLELVGNLLNGLKKYENENPVEQKIVVEKREPVYVPNEKDSALLQRQFEAEQERKKQNKTLEEAVMESISKTEQNI